MNTPSGPVLPMAERRKLGDKLRAQKDSLALELSDALYLRHAEWLVRFGEPGKRKCSEDVGYHLEYLAAAIEGDSICAFEDYARWLASMFASRGIASERTVETFEQIRILVGRQTSPVEGSIVARFIERACAALTSAHNETMAASKSSLMAQERSVFLNALLKGPRKLTATIPLEALRQGCALTDIYVEIYQESLYEIGRLWETNQITVAQEHMATATVQWSIAQLYPHIELPPTPRGNAIITGVQGEHHQVGANLVADALEAEGWNVRFLGTNMPHAGILEAIEEHEAKLVGISVTMLTNVPQLRQLIGEVKRRFGNEKPRVVLGGAAFRNSSELAVELSGGDPCLDVRAALEMCNRPD